MPAVWPESKRDWSFVIGYWIFVIGSSITDIQFPMTNHQFLQIFAAKIPRICSDVQGADGGTFSFVRICDIRSPYEITALRVAHWRGYHWGDLGFVSGQ
jgi:hypothetical protein